MNKYFVVSIQIMKDDTQAQGIFTYENKKEAFSAYHTTLASNYVSDALKSFSVAVLNYLGATEKVEFWDEPEVEE